MSETADYGLLSPSWAGSPAESLTSDHAFLTALLRTEAELLRTLVEVGIAPASTGELAASAIDPGELAVEAVADGNPVVPLVRRWRASAGAGAEWIHYGATSQDILDTAMMLVATDVSRAIVDELGAVVETLRVLVERHRGVPVVARTLGQQALPTSLGLRLAGWLTGVQDARGTLGPLPASLGGPVGTAHVYGADGPAVLEAFAERLGLAAPTLSWHTRRGAVLGLANALVTVGAACGKIAADVLVMSQTEIGEVREASGGTSSSMAHKENPVRSILIASAARQLPALASIIGTSAVAEQERPTGAWHAEWEPLRTMLRLAGGAAALTRDLVAGLVFDEDAFARNLEVLRNALGAGEDWTTPHLAAANVWIDRAMRG